MISYRLFLVEQGLSFYKNHKVRSMSTGARGLILYCRNSLLNSLFYLTWNFFNLININQAKIINQQRKSSLNKMLMNQNQSEIFLLPLQLHNYYIFNQQKSIIAFVDRNMSNELNPQNTMLRRIEDNYAKLSQDFQFVRDAVTFLESVLIQFPKTTFISFNGGKDATIVLVLTHLAVKNLQKQQIQSSIQMPQGIFFTQPDPFPQMDQFYTQIVKEFGLIMHTRPTQKIPHEMTELTKEKQVDCVIMGSRKDDWCGDIGLRAPSDTHKGYPAFMRINPIMYWQYDKIWPVIYALEIPYCKLYQEGYTSLGNKSNSVKNQSLLVEGNTYKHAAEAKAETQRDCRLADKAKENKQKRENIV